MRYVDLLRRGRTGFVVTLSVLAVTFASRARADDLPPSAPSTPTQPPPTSTQPPPVIIVETPPEQAPADEPKPARPKHETGVAARVHGGLGQRSLFGDSILGADLTASLGGHVDNVCIYADVQLLFASDNGLAFRQYRFGPAVDFEIVSRVRLGAGLSVGGTTLERATNGKTMEAWSWGAHVLASVDLFQIEGRTALYLLGELSVDSAGTFLGSSSRNAVPISSMWGPTIAAGVRF